MEWDERQVTHHVADLSEARLHYVAAGDGPLVVLLHGFPEFWYSWRYQIPVLAAAGYRVVAPDLRGYNLSSKPRGLRAYRAERLAGDVADLIAAQGASRAAVVGHDWGGGVAWATAMLFPTLVERLAILNVPHPARLERGLRTWRQLRKSWYIFFFALPWLPEIALRRGAPIRIAPLRPDALTAADRRRYAEALAQPGALTAAINYYRALVLRPPGWLRSRLRRIEQPVLVIWGERDRYLGPELAAPDPRWAPHARVERLPDAGHWVQQDQPARVNALLLEFLRQ